MQSINHKRHAVLICAVIMLALVCAGCPAGSNIGRAENDVQFAIDQMITLALAAKNDHVITEADAITIGGYLSDLNQINAQIIDDAIQVRADMKNANTAADRAAIEQNGRELIFTKLRLMAELIGKINNQGALPHLLHFKSANAKQDFSVLLAILQAAIAQLTLAANQV